MRVYHDSRRIEFRSPFGAVTIGQTVRLRLDVRDDPGAICVCHFWREGSSEKAIEMAREQRDDFLLFSCSVSPESADIFWYSFIITGSDGQVRYYGVRDGRSGGEGTLRDGRTPAFQLTVYQAEPVPEWFKGAVFYQIFPDSFNRGADWQQRSGAALAEPRKGIQKALRPAWDSPQTYQKDAAGRVTRWDFYGGTLSGIIEKLEYLRDLGITAIYLNPIFAATSNHRYDTADYYRIDPMLGDEKVFSDLCDQAKAMGISIMLDGVFSHSGCDSRYFNKFGNYDSPGAWQDPASPYRSWYRFDASATGYECWWGVDDLPNLEENDPVYRDFICGPDGVVAHWLRTGARAWRLDVADELPDNFIACIHTAARTERFDAVVLGEVWEDASNKRSYGHLRRFLLGGELDSVMNYPFRDNILNFLLGRISAGETADRFCSLYENYPPDAFYSALNLLGSHDRPRVLTVLGGAPDESALSESDRAKFRLSAEQKKLGLARLWLATLLQMTFPGVPSVYYGDEAGLEGYSDPFNRASYPWGQENCEAADIAINAIALRNSDPLFITGRFEPFSWTDDVFGFYRTGDSETAVVLVNRSLDQPRIIELPARGRHAAELVTGRMAVNNGKIALTLPPLKSAVVRMTDGSGFCRPVEPGNGVLCHISSLPGNSTRRFIDQLAASGMRYWQVLPVTTTDVVGSPYAGYSAFAGNTALLGLRDEDMLERFSKLTDRAEFEIFCSKNAGWLDPFCAFAAIRSLLPEIPWQDWPAAYSHYSGKLLNDPALADKIHCHAFFQFEFYREWQALRDYAHSKGILIIGDLPMYVAEDSADTWSRPELFKLDAGGRAAQVAGVPPDYFAPEGQLWNNPVFDWDALKNEGYEWWLKRLAHAFNLYDYVRLDHFRGFESYWSVPAGQKALAGRWRPGPGITLFEAAFARFGPLPIIAEDLGQITPAVRALVARCGFPGMDVMQFSEDDVRSDSFRIQQDRIAYTGTHDNQTLVGWCSEKYPDENPREVARELMARLLNSGASVVIMPLQDILGLGDEARMNTPGTDSGNWQWQADESALKQILLNFHDLLGN